MSQPIARPVRRRALRLALTSTAAMVVASSVLFATPGQAADYFGIDVTLSAPAEASGTVVGKVSAHAPAGSKVTYRVAKPAKGKAVIAADGTLTYTPTPDARHRAAKVGAAKSARRDILRVTVGDGRGHVTVKQVEVAVLGADQAPVVTDVVVGKPDPATGVVTGRVVVTDPDGDPITFHLKSDTSVASAQPVDWLANAHVRSLGAVPTIVCPSSQGSMDVAADGSFTYTPTAAARTSTAPSTDDYTVTSTDGYGGATSIPVSVPTGSYGGGFQASNGSTGVTTGG